MMMTMMIEMTYNEPTASPAIRRGESDMGNDPMGKVLVTAKIESVEDAYKVKFGLIPADQARTLVVTDALVDTGATELSMPKRLITQLGLTPFATRKTRTAGGLTTLQVYRAVRLVVQERECTCDVIELPDECPVCIGQIPLEALDFVVDPRGQKLIGNPEHNGEHMVDVL
jgi:predicted aspartyl protease